MKCKIFFRRRNFFEIFLNFPEIFEKTRKFHLKIEKSSFRKNSNFWIFWFFRKIPKKIRVFFRNFEKKIVAEKIFCISYCNFTSNKSIVDFLDIFRCRFFPRRRWIRLKHANLQREAAHKKKEHRSNIFSFRIRSSCSQLHPAVPQCSVMLENHRNTNQNVQNTSF